jgi:hypothetical protein
MKRLVAEYTLSNDKYCLKEDCENISTNKFISCKQNMYAVLSHSYSVI